VKTVSDKDARHLLA